MKQEEIDKAFENRWRIKGNFGKMNQNAATMSFDEYFEYIKGLCRDFFESGLVLADKGEEQIPLIKTKNDKNLFDRSIPFNQSVFNTANIQKYGQQMLQDFYEYWTEPNPSHTKMRFELQKTWDVNRRLARWARNNYNRYDRQQQPTTDEQRISRLADILTD